MKKTVVWFAALCLISLAGCGGAQANKPAPCRLPPGHKPTNLLVLGNSITHKAPIPAEGWYGNWGMAAPSAAADFSHLTASAMNVPVTAMNLAIETEPVTSLPQIPAIASQIGPGTAVILQFGDDVPSGVLEALLFRTAYDELAAAVSKGTSLVCVSTWWEKPSIDNLIKAVCGKHGGCYAYIGDLFTDPANTDVQTIEYANHQINAHPREWGHRHIAERVFAQNPWRQVRPTSRFASGGTADETRRCHKFAPYLRLFRGF